MDAIKCKFGKSSNPLMQASVTVGQSPGKTCIKLISALIKHCTVSQVRQQLGITPILQCSMNRQATRFSKSLSWLYRISQFFGFELATNYQTELLEGVMHFRYY